MTNHKIIGNKEEKSKLEELVEQAKKDPVVQRAIGTKGVDIKKEEPAEEKPVTPPAPGVEPEKRPRRFKGEGEIRKMYRLRIEQWKNEGYDTSALAEVLDNDADLKEIKYAFDIYRKKVYRLKDIEVELLLFSRKGIDDLLKKVKADLKDINKLEDIEAWYKEFGDYMRTRINDPNIKPPEYPL